MRRPRRRNPVAFALYLNAGLLGAILVALVARGGGLSFAAPAYGAPIGNPPAVGASGNLVLMPAQFSSNLWGCYVLDAEKRTLAAYQYFHGRSQLQLVSARQIGQDLELKNWNTPDIREIQKMVELERNAVRGRVGDVAPPQPQPDKPDADHHGPVEPAGPDAPPGTRPGNIDPTPVPGPVEPKPAAPDDGRPPVIEPAPPEPAGDKPPVIEPKDIDRKDIDPNDIAPKDNAPEDTDPPVIEPLQPGQDP